MSYHNPRIEMMDSILSAVMKMSEGNPGAANVLMKLYTEGAKIDPDDFMGGFGAILSLDTLDIYGSEIWMFYKDLCKQNLVDMAGMMRANQLGFISETELKNAIKNGAPNDNFVADALAKVRDRLPAFAK